MNFNRVKIITTAPPADANAIRQALGEAGAGQLGEYRFCSFSYVGMGRFTPLPGAHPHIGEPNQPQMVEEEQIEVICAKENAKQVVTALRKAHPYETPVIDIVPLLDEHGL